MDTMYISLLGGVVESINHTCGLNPYSHIGDYVTPKLALLTCSLRRLNASKTLRVLV